MTDLNQTIKDLSLAGLLESLDKEQLEIRSWEDIAEGLGYEEEEAKDLFKFYTNLLAILDFAALMRNSKG